MATLPEAGFNRNAVRPVDCLKGGWDLIRGQYWLILAMCVVAWVISAAVPLGILMGPMMCGLFLTFFKIRRGEPVEFGTLFTGFDYFRQSIVATLLHVIPILAIGIPAYVLVYVFLILTMVAQGGQDPSPVAVLTIVIVFALFVVVMMALIMLVSIGFMFVYPLIVDRGVEGLDAVKLSFRAAIGNFSGLLGLIMLNFLMSLAGMLLCLIGVYLVIPISYAAIAMAYEQVFGLRTPEPTPAPPPPPVFT